MSEDNFNIIPAMLACGIIGTGPITSSLGRIAALKRAAPSQYEDRRAVLTNAVTYAVTRLLEEGRSSVIPEIAAHLKSDGLSELLNGTAQHVAAIMDSFNPRKRESGTVVDLASMRAAHKDAVADKREWNIPVSNGARSAADPASDLKAYRMRTVTPKPNSVIDFALAVSESPPVRDALFHYFASNPRSWHVAQDSACRRMENPLDILGASEGGKSLVKVSDDHGRQFIQPVLSPREAMRAFERTLSTLERLGVKELHIDIRYG